MLSNGRKMKTSTNKRHHGIRPASYLLQKYIDKDPTHLKSILCKLNQEKHSEVKNSLKQYFTGTEFNHTFLLLLPLIFPIQSGSLQQNTFSMQNRWINRLFASI